MVDIAVAIPAFSGVGEETENVAVKNLDILEGVRTAGLSEGHLCLLMQAKGPWPPIVLWSDKRLVIDGAHRVEAARRLGRPTLPAVLFNGTRDEAFMEAVHLNIDHGLPLSLEDRRRAASLILTSHADWSNERIAEVCGVSSRVISRLRRKTDDPLAGRIDHPTERRTGRDGRNRPVEPQRVRERIMSALESDPSASLRTIAMVTGASPETVRTVKSRLSKGEHSVGPRQEQERRLSTSPERVLRRSGPQRANSDSFWLSDTALLASGKGVEFGQWFDATKLDISWRQYVSEVPISRIYLVADEARRRASAWIAFATAREARTRE